MVGQFCMQPAMPGGFPCTPSYARLDAERRGQVLTSVVSAAWRALIGAESRVTRIVCFILVSIFIKSLRSPYVLQSEFTYPSLLPWAFEAGGDASNNTVPTSTINTCTPAVIRLKPALTMVWW